MRSRTVAERIALVYRVILMLAWSSAVLVVVLAYQGRDVGSTWVARAVMLSLAALATLGFVLLARHQLRKAIARPVPTTGVNGWFFRQPGWSLALLVLAGNA